MIPIAPPSLALVQYDAHGQQLRPPGALAMLFTAPEAWSQVLSDCRARYSYAQRGTTSRFIAGRGAAAFRLPVPAVAHVFSAPALKPLVLMILPA